MFPLHDSCDAFRTPARTSSCVYLIPYITNVYCSFCPLSRTVFCERFQNIDEINAAKITIRFQYSPEISNPSLEHP